MVELNMLERSLARVAPRWGLRRLSDKYALEQAQSVIRKYDGARRDRRTASWNATGGSANAEIAPALETVRKRTRDMVRNNEWASNGKRKLQAHIVGTGFTFRPAASVSKATKKKAAECWADFEENCDPSGLSDFNGVQTQAIGEVVEGGAAFIRWYVRPPEWGLKVPLQCEVLEHDYLDTRKNEANDDRIIINGVEFDRNGRRLAYWLFPHHPGEISILSKGRFQSERVPSSEVDHIFRVDRPGQVTGIPWFAPLLLRLRDAADYEEAEQIRKKIEACFTVFVTQPEQGSFNIVQAGQQEKDKDSRLISKIAPGLVTNVPAGGEVTTASPQPNGSYVDYMSQQLLAASAGIGLTFAQFTGNLKDVNFTSMREGKLDFYAVLDQWQWLMCVPMLCRPAWRRVMAVSAGRGLLPTANIRSEIAPTKRPWVDPLKDIKAEQLEMLLGLESWSDKVAARGYDPDERIEAIIAEKEKLEKAGIDLSSIGRPSPKTQDINSNEIKPK